MYDCKLVPSKVPALTTSSTPSKFRAKNPSIAGFSLRILRVSVLLLASSSPSARVYISTTCGPATDRFAVAVNVYSMLLKGAISAVTVSITSVPPSTRRAISKLLIATDALFCMVTATVSVAERLDPFARVDAIGATSFAIGKFSKTSTI